METRTNRRIGAFALMDALVSSVLLAVCIAGLASLWVFCLNQVQRSRELTLAGQIARAEVEQAKVYGYPNLPKGPYNSQSGDARWTGTHIRSANSGRGAWSQKGETYYDVAGKLCTSTDSKARFVTMAELRDTDIAPNQDQSDYDLALNAKRTLVVSVFKLPARAVLVRMSTEFVRSGL